MMMMIWIGPTMTSIIIIMCVHISSEQTCKAMILNKNNCVYVCPTSGVSIGLRTCLGTWLAHWLKRVWDSFPLLPIQRILLWRLSFKFSIYNGYLSVECTRKWTNLAQACALVGPGVVTPLLTTVLWLKRLSSSDQQYTHQPSQYYLPKFTPIHVNPQHPIIISHTNFCAGTCILSLLLV